MASSSAPMEHLSNHGLREDLLQELTSESRWWESRIKQDPMNYERDDSDAEAMSCDSASNASIYSYQSSRDAVHFIYEINGRVFNATNPAYILPVDDIEHSRLDKQHLMLHLAMGALYPAKGIVQAALSPLPHRTRMILDLGCGSGIWAKEMAMDFPHAQVVGVDLAPCAIEKCPPNCRFELDDINLGLKHFYGQFDVVHMRCVGAGLSSYTGAVAEAMLCLRPGGIGIFAEGDFDLVRWDQVQFQHARDGPWRGGSALQKMFNEVRKAQIRRCGITSMMDSPEVLDKGFWDNPYFVPESCGAGGVYNPIGPWANSGDLEEAQRLGLCGTLGRQNMISFIHAARQHLIEEGFTDEWIDELTAACEEEMASMEFQNWIRWRYSWGQRSTYVPPLTTGTNTGITIPPAVPSTMAPSTEAPIPSQPNDPSIVDPLSPLPEPALQAPYYPPPEPPVRNYDPYAPPEVYPPVRGIKVGMAPARPSNKWRTFHQYGQPQAMGYIEHRRRAPCMRPDVRGC